MKEGEIYWPNFILLLSVTFMAIISELIPSGILPELTQGLKISETQAGNLLGFYAIASAIFSIPLISATVGFSRKKLLLGLLMGFALGNFLVGISTSYGIALLGRMIGGICAGILWPMVASFGMKLTDKDHKGFAVAFIMSGTTFGMSLGLPIFTAIGRNISWRVEFFAVSLVIFLIGVLTYFILPEVSGEIRDRANSPFTLIRNKGVLIVMLLTSLAAIANYGVYTYITNLIRAIDYPRGIGFAQVLFGLGSIISVLIAARVIDRHIRSLTIFMFTSALLALIIFAFFSNYSLVCDLAFLLWGIGFGALVSLFQTAVARQVRENASAVATSLQSASFNFSIMLASALAGSLLTNYSVKFMLSFMCLVLIAGIGVAFLSKKTLS